MPSKHPQTQAYGQRVIDVPILLDTVSGESELTHQKIGGWCDHNPFLFHGRETGLVFAQSDTPHYHFGTLGYHFGTLARWAGYDAEAYDML